LKRKGPHEFLEKTSCNLRFVMQSGVVVGLSLGYVAFSMHA
jgi:hypothetical protein